MHLRRELNGAPALRAFVSLKVTTGTKSETFRASYANLGQPPNAVNLYIGARQTGLTPQAEIRFDDVRLVIYP